MEEPSASSSSTESLSDELESKEMPDAFDESFISGMVTTTLELGSRREPPLPPGASSRRVQRVMQEPPVPEHRQRSVTDGERTLRLSSAANQNTTEDFLVDDSIIEQLRNQPPLRLDLTDPPIPADVDSLSVDSVSVDSVSVDSLSVDSLSVDSVSVDSVSVDSVNAEPQGPESSAVQAARSLDQGGPRDDALGRGSAARMIGSTTDLSPNPVGPSRKMAPAAAKSARGRRLTNFLRAAGYGAVTFLALVGMAALGYALAVSGLLG